MNKAIIHLSDLHVSLHKDLNDLDLKSSIKTLLNSDVTDPDCLAFIDEFCSFVKQEYPDTELYLLVTGDIANVSEVDEYTAAQFYLERIIKELGISVSNTMIIPGDHDVNRDNNKYAHTNGKADNPHKKSYEYQEEKLKNFSDFYKNFYKQDFSFKAAIVSIIEFPEELLLIAGLNSTHMIDYKGGDGFIDLETLRAELEQLDEKFPTHSKIAAVHHNMFSSFENKATGQWEHANRISVISLLQKHNFKCLICGNEHTRGSGSNSQNNIYYSDPGAFTSSSPAASFKIYPINSEQGSLSLGLQIFVLQNAKKVAIDHKFGSWGLLRNKDISELAEIQLIEPPVASIQENPALDTLGVDPLPEIEVATAQTVSNLVSYKNDFYSAALFKIVKDKKLFHSGHFHWSETSRAHNWIDISNILNHKDDLSLAKNAILDVISECNLVDQFDFIIGLGIEGTILSTRAAVKYNKPFSFLPYSYRYDEHSPYEKQLNFDNKGEYKSVLIITDVVHDGRTLRKLINKREPGFFAKVERIMVISLFYTGEGQLDNPRILNSNVLEIDPLTDHEEERIEYYYILPLKVERCPYDHNFRTECLIVREGLGCVHHFYDENKALEKISADEFDS